MRGGAGWWCVVCTGASQCGVVVCGVSGGVCMCVWGGGDFLMEFKQLCRFVGTTRCQGERGGGLDDGSEGVQGAVEAQPAPRYINSV